MIQSVCWPRRRRSFARRRSCFVGIERVWASRRGRLAQVVGSASTDTIAAMTEDLRTIPLSISRPDIVGQTVTVQWAAGDRCDYTTGVVVGANEMGFVLRWKAEAEDKRVFINERWYPWSLAVVTLQHEDPRRGHADQQAQKANADALDLILRYGGIDGSHHKTWVLDQVVRLLAGDGYEAWVAEARAGEDGPETYAWDVGTPP